MLKSISAQEAKKLIEEKKGDPKFHILDVRTQEEFGFKKIDGAENLDFYEPHFQDMLQKLDKKETYLVYCRSGSRSKMVLEMMRELGFQEVYEADGGIISF